MTRVAVIWANYGPYHMARAQALSKLKGVDPVFIELAVHDELRAWEVDKGSVSLITLMDAPYDRCSAKELGHKVADTLESIRPDAVVTCGYDTAPMRAAARWARANGRASILMFATTEWDRKRPWWRELGKRWLIRRYYDSGFVGGRRHRQYLTKLGMPDQHVWERYNVVDNDYFARKAKEARLNGQEQRDRLGLQERYFLYVGRFSPEKNPKGLLEAYRSYYSAHSGGWGLVLVGDGPQFGELRRFARAVGLDHIQWPGFKQIDELPSYYALGSGFVLPSASESWGLVVNEAMACGLPVLVSERCGCAADLVQEGRNGYTFDPHNVDELAERMSMLASLGQAERDTLARRSEEIIAGFTPEVWANNLADCITRTVARRSRKKDAPA